MRFGLVTLLLSLSVAVASPAQAITGEEWVRLKVANLLRPGATFATVDAEMARFFDAADPEMKGVSQHSYDLLDQVKRAEKRAREIARVMAFDLDGDGVVTREELETGLAAQARQFFQQRGLGLGLGVGLGVEPTREQFLAVREKLMAPYLADDFRKDGRITLDEMQRAADQQPDYAPPFSERVPLDLSSRGDGVVTREDYEAALRRAYDSFDVDHDGTISAAAGEAAAASLRDLRMRQAAEEREARDAERFARILPKCGIPKASADAVVDRVTTDLGTGMSNLMLNDPKYPASVADVVVTAGSAPLYLQTA